MRMIIVTMTLALFLGWVINFCFTTPNQVLNMIQGVQK